MTPRAARRARQISAYDQQAIVMLRKLADRVAAGEASTALRIRFEPEGEIWLVAATVASPARRFTRGTGNKP